MKWVVRIIILSFLYVFSKSQIYLLAEVSIPEVGSSSMITLDFPAKEMATDNLLLCPPDKFLAYSSLFSFKLTSAINLVIYSYFYSSSSPSTDQPLIVDAELDFKSFSQLVYVGMFGANHLVNDHILRKESSATNYF